MRKRKIGNILRPKSFYDLTEVKSKIRDGQFLINSDVSRDAWHDFGWNTDDIKDAYNKLMPKHFYKKDCLKNNPYVVIDVYKVHINGESIYTHFYIDDLRKILVINSFHKQVIN